MAAPPTGTLTMAVLDTSFLIDFEHGLPSALRQLEALEAAKEPLLVPALVALEFAGGSKEPRRVWEALRRAYTILDFTASTAERASLMAGLALREGRFPGWSDIQVAATALEHDEILVSGDTAGFGTIPGLRLRTYR